MIYTNTKGEIFTDPSELVGRYNYIDGGIEYLYVREITDFTETEFYSEIFKIEKL